MIQTGIFHDSPPDKLHNLYLQRYAWPGPLLADEPNNNTGIIVVIPCFNEPHILASLNSLFECETPNCKVEIIVVVNHAENEADHIKIFNQDTCDKIQEWIINHKKKYFSCYLLKVFDLPRKHAGVGLARKIGMDEAVRRFEFINNKNGIIICFDADCYCSPNYLQEVYQCYQNKPEINTALVYFEHPLEGNFNSSLYESIINYELHLRYFKNALQFADFPYAFHTIGSCITVTSAAYQKQGGMNKRKAGEDFYFLQKIFPLGNICTINSTTVFPSPRPSNRVPFGTGKAINDMLKTRETRYVTYNPQIFIDLRILFTNVSNFYQEKYIDSIIKELPISIQEYLNTIHFIDLLAKINKNCSSEKQFFKAFFNWFNGFMVLKYIHFARDNYYIGTEILEATNWILMELTSIKLTLTDKKKALLHLRDLDKSN